jgi:hypothetical protein
MEKILDKHKIHAQALKYFLAHQTELCAQYNGKELLMQGPAVIAAYPTFQDAVREGRRRFGGGNFSVQKCVPGEDAYTVELGALGLCE